MFVENQRLPKCVFKLHTEEEEEEDEEEEKLQQKKGVELCHANARAGFFTYSFIFSIEQI